MTVRPGLKISTRDLLIQAATRLFAEHGFDGTSVRDITEASGCNAAMVSYHFGGKEGLYSACIEPYALSKVDAARTILIPTSNEREFRDQMIRFCEAMFDLWLAQPAVSRLVAQECNLGFKKTERIFRDTFFKCFDIFSNYFAQGQEAGLVRPDIDPHNLAALLFASMHEVMRMSDLLKKFRNVDLDDPGFRSKLIQDWASITLNGALTAPRLKATQL